jgi:hypothetical protein
MEFNIVKNLQSKYLSLCEKGGKACGQAIGYLSGHAISSRYAQKIATEVLKVLPIALAFFLMTPTLSLTSLVLTAAVCSTALLLDRKHLSVSGKVKVLEGAALGLALQTGFTILCSVVALSLVSAVGAGIIGTGGIVGALYASRNVKA